MSMHLIAQGFHKVVGILEQCSEFLLIPVIESETDLHDILFLLHVKYGKTFLHEIIG